MRVLFWLALLANLLFFAYMQWGNMLTGTQDGSQAQPQLNPQKIRLLPASSVSTASASLHPASAVTQSVATAVAPAVCMEWGEFSGDDLARASAALAAMKLGKRLSQHQVEHDNGYWVYMPPQPNHAGAEKKVAELRALGVKDYFIVQDSGKWHNAISLGVFKTEEAARNYLAGLEKQGVRTAVVGERQAKLMFTVFVLRNPDSSLTARIVALQKGFPDSELKAAACD